MTNGPPESPEQIDAVGASAQINCYQWFDQSRLICTFQRKHIPYQSISNNERLERLVVRLSPFDDNRIRMFGVDVRQLDELKMDRPMGLVEHIRSKRMEC